MKTEYTREELTMLPPEFVQKSCVLCWGTGLGMDSIVHEDWCPLNHPAVTKVRMFAVTFEGEVQSKEVAVLELSSWQAHICQSCPVGFRLCPVQSAKNQTGTCTHEWMMRNCTRYALEVSRVKE